MHEPTVIIDPADYARWLTVAEPPVDLLRPHPTAEMGAYPVSKKVNSPAIQGAGAGGTDRDLRLVKIVAAGKRGDGTVET